VGKSAVVCCATLPIMNGYLCCCCCCHEWLPVLLSYSLRTSFALAAQRLALPTYRRLLYWLMFLCSIVAGLKQH